MNTSELRKIQRFLNAARDHIDTDMTVQKLQVLIEVALSEPLDQGTLVQKVNQTRSAVSKNVANWSALTYKKDKGPGFIRSDLDPMNLKTRILTITDRGKAALAKALKEAKL